MEWHQLDEEDQQQQDPNKLFSSPFAPFKTNPEENIIDDVKEDARSHSSTVHSQSITTCEMSEFLRLSKCQISDFWGKHSHRFVVFWSAMTPLSRENFLRRVYPRIIQDFMDRYCYLDQVKQYRHDYDEILVLSPYLNVVDLSYHSNLVSLLDKYSLDSVLVSEASEMVLRFRDMHVTGVLPLTPREEDVYARALRLRRGDCLLLCDAGTLEFGEVVVVENPRTVLLPTGGVTHSLYKSGYLFHPFEFRKVTENIAFIATLLNDVISVFTSEVMSKDTAYLRSLASRSLKAGDQCAPAKALMETFAISANSSSVLGSTGAMGGGRTGRRRRRTDVDVAGQQQSAARDVQQLIRAHLTQMSSVSAVRPQLSSAAAAVSVANSSASSV